MTRVIAAASNIFFSLILGAIALAFCAVQYPEITNEMLVFAEGLKRKLTNSGIPVQYNIWIKFLIQEQQLVFMFFVIIMRVLFALVVWTGGTLINKAFGTAR